ncbi:MAG: sugar phosphate isomerase/epimerase [Clostridia bacterium]|nr:sugar phosphate isomerase/epimerase [Clostridia bacterium]
MKVSVVSRGITCLEGEDKYKALEECGISAFDFTISNTNDELYSLCEEDFLKRLSLEHEIAKRHGVEIYQTHGPWRIPIDDSTEETRAERMEKMKLALKGTRVLGAKCMVIHPIMPFGTDDIEKHKEAETKALNTVFMRELASTAEQEGVTLCLENLPFPSFSLAKPDKVCELIREINSDFCKMCFDAGHANVFPELTVANEMKKHGALIRALHLHDNDGHGDNHLMPCFGRLDWISLGKVYSELELSCPFNYEAAPPRNAPLPIFKAYLKSMVDIAHQITSK